MKHKNAPIPYTLSPQELRALQLTLTDMLKEVDRICKKYNIRYNLFGGTMLGAVRHEGFIPWDDDLDVAMTREEYLKFRDACSTDLDARQFFFQDHTTDPGYPWGYARIRHKDSEFIRLGQEHMTMKTGIFLDIFPLDSVPNTKPLRALNCFYCFLLRKLLYAESGKINGKTPFLRGLYKLMSLIPRCFVFRRIDSLAQRSMKRRSRYMRVITFPLPKRRRYGMERVWFEETADIVFEDGVYPGIKDYDGFLSYFYGDYMKLPPPEARRWHPASRFRLPSSQARRGIS